MLYRSQFGSQQVDAYERERTCKDRNKNYASGIYAF